MGKDTGKATVNQIQEIINNFKSQMSNLHSSGKKAFDSSKNDLVKGLEKLQLEDPVFVPYSLGNDMKDILQSISKAAADRQELQMFYAGEGLYEQVQGVCVEYPVFTKRKGFNILIKPFDTSLMPEVKNAESTLNQYLLYVLLSYPRGSVRINFIDPDFVGLGDAFMQPLGGGVSPICRVFRDRQEIENCLDKEMSKRMEDISRVGNRYYENHPRYELFVIFNNPNSYQYYSNPLNKLLNVGAQYGIQFVVLSDIHMPTDTGYNTFNILANRGLYTELDNEKKIPGKPSLVNYSIDLFSREDVFKQCLHYLQHGLGEDTPKKFESFTPLPIIQKDTDPDKYFEKLESITSKNVTIPVLNYNTYEHLSRGKYGIRQKQLLWQVGGNKKKNIVISYSGQSEDRAIELLNHLAMEMLLSLPVTKVHFSLVNHLKNPWARFLDKNIDNRIVDVIYDNNRIPALFSSLSKKMEEDSDQLGCSLEEKNLEDGTVFRPYEIVVLNASDSVGYRELREGLFKNGADSGIYFIVMNNKDEQTPYLKTDSVLNQTTVIQTIDADEDFSIGIPQETIQNANLFTRNKEWMSAATKYINDHSVVKVSHDWDAIINAPYPATSPDMSVIIGYEQGTGMPIEYKLDIAHSHYHSFVIGGTGSGKTSFLHNVILSLALKYSPEDLELYLIDLKGPEFGRYKQLQQCGAVLVDKSDDVITYDVIGNLVKKMRDRKDLFEDSGGSLTKYNKKHPDSPLPQILLIIDECQNLYKANTENHDLARKIVDAITLIATEGRAFGIHLLMATQSLNNCPLLDQGVLTQFQDFWILPCVDTDAKMLVKAEHKEIVGIEADRMEREKEINKGQCFLQGTDGGHRFKFNFISDESKGEDKSMLERFIEQSVKKAEGHASNGQVFFSGRQHYSLYENTNRLISQDKSYLIASAGQNISFDQAPNMMHLINEQGQNILTMGYNDKLFATRTTIDILLSLILSSRKNELGYRFMVINCLGIKGSHYTTLLKSMAENGYIELIEPKNSGEHLKSLCAEIGDGNVTPTILSILSQERFTFLKNNEELVSVPKKPSEEDEFILPGQDDFENTMSVMADLNFEGSAPKNELPTEVKTYRDALRYILQVGPEYGVHTILQVNKASELALPKSDGFTMDNIGVYKLFGHIVFLQTDKDTETFFSLYELQLDEMQEEEDRLRAYYFNPNGGDTQLLSPYTLPTKKIEKKKNEFESFLNVEATINELIRNY